MSHAFFPFHIAIILSSTYNLVFVLRAAQKASHILLKIHQIIMDIQCRLTIYKVHVNAFTLKRFSFIFFGCCASYYWLVMHQEDGRYFLKGKDFFAIFSWCTLTPLNYLSVQVKYLHQYKGPHF